MTVSIGQICDDVSSIEVVAYLDDPPVEMRIDTETGATTAEPRRQAALCRTLDRRLLGHGHAFG